MIHVSIKRTDRYGRAQNSHVWYEAHSVCCGSGIAYIYGVDDARTCTKIPLRLFGGVFSHDAHVNATSLTDYKGVRA